MLKQFLWYVSFLFPVYGYESREMLGTTVCFRNKYLTLTFTAFKISITEIYFVKDFQ